MKNELPILFNTKMVKAILEGRKTQTRRPIKGGELQRNPDNDPWYKDCIWSKRTKDGCWGDYTNDLLIEKFSPFNSEYLWVRETFHQSVSNIISYKADYTFNPFNELEVSEFCSLGDYSMVGEKWTPSIHMPRESSRILLKVNRQWVERIQNISVLNCINEGINHDADLEELAMIKAIGDGDDRHKEVFADLWESCGYDWDSNPWVWCCEFEVVKVKK